MSESRFKDMALVDSILVFIFSLVIGSIGVYVGARLVTGESDFGYAVLTALIGALIWSVVGFLIGWIPLLGPALTFLVWLGFINGRYEGGWLSALLITAFAWLTVIVIFYILGATGFATPDALGLPGL